MHIKRPAVLLFVFLLIFDICLLSFLYLKSKKTSNDYSSENNIVSNIVENNRNCNVQLIAKSSKFNLKIENKDKWNNFINTLGNCKNGKFTIHTIDYNSTETRQVNSIKYIIDEGQYAITFKNSKSDIALYTYSILFDEKNSQAILNIGFSNGNIATKDSIDNAILLSSYFMFNGVPYSKYEPKMALFSSLEALGLTYETF